MMPEVNISIVFTNLARGVSKETLQKNWRRFKQQYHFYLTAKGSVKKDDMVKIAIFVNCH